MDVVLEAFDTFLFDRCYASALPISPDFSTFDPVSTLAASLKSLAASNETFARPHHAPVARSAWQWEPSNSYFALQPSEYAYQSRWDRDNIFRQALSLYIITW
jgi:lathosterol oxidase